MQPFRRLTARRYRQLSTTTSLDAYISKLKEANSLMQRLNSFGTPGTRSFSPSGGNLHDGNEAR